MKIFYVKDPNSRIFIVFSPNNIPPTKDLDGFWQLHDQALWFNLADATFLSPILNLLDLSDIPEPSSEDKSPMELHYKPIKMSYTYDE